MKTIELSNGYKVELEENTMDNMELVDALAEAADDDPLAVSKICKLILGEEKRKGLYDAIRKPDGRVPVAEVSNCIKEIFDSFGDQGKK